MQNARRQTPEDLFGEDAIRPLHVDVVCGRCDCESNHDVPWGLIHPEPEKCEADGWDGVLLGRVIECPSCGVPDDYALTSMAKLGLLARVIASRGVTSEPTGVRVGVAALFDGTVVRRPTQALGRLRKYVSEEPESGEAWRRLGNACNRYGREAEAEEAWLRAVKADARECEAAFSLVERCLATRRPDEATSFLQLAIQRFAGTRNLDAVLRRRMADAITNHLEGLVHSDGPAALEAVWRDGALGNEPIVRMSAVDLRKIVDWERLAAFLGTANLLTLRLTADVPPEGSTQLESLLRDETLLDYTPSQPFVRASPKVGRNDPCACGSGRKFKRCCAESMVSVRRVS